MVALIKQLLESLESLDASSPKLINIDVIGTPRPVVVTQSPEHFLRQCKKKLRSKEIFFTGKADRKDVVQLLSDFEESIAVQFDQMRAEHLNLRSEDLAQVITEVREARRTRIRKLLQRLTVHEERTPILHESEPTHTIHAVHEAAVATKYPELKPTEGTAAPSPQARSLGAAAAPPSMSVRDGPPSSPPAHLRHQIPAAPLPKPTVANEYRRAPGKPPCRYGRACYREEPHHFRHFDHPSDHPRIARGGSANDDHRFVA